MRHQTSQILYAYWNDVRGERSAPRRFDIEPAQLGTVLAETFILECDAAQSASFRLAGTKICDTFGREFRGESFYDVFGTHDRGTLMQAIDEVQQQAAVLVVDAEVNVANQGTVAFEILLLPLVHTGTTISRILGSVAAIDPPSWLGTERLPRLDMTYHQHIWPDGRPHAIAEKFRNPPALIPELVGARIVRINRRSFRILDGGLGKN